MNNRTLLRTGIAGLSAPVGYLGITIYALRRGRPESACCSVPSGPEASTLGGRR